MHYELDSSLVSYTLLLDSLNFPLPLQFMVFPLAWSPQQQHLSKTMGASLRTPNLKAYSGGIDDLVLDTHEC